MQKAVVKLDYTNLSEWLSYYKLTWTDLAIEAGVSGQAVSRYKAAGRPFPTTWILAWRKAYRWTWQQVVQFCLEN